MIRRADLRRWFWAALQFVGTVLILVFVPGAVLKTLSFLAWWGLTLGRLTRGEAVLYLVSCVLFTAMDIMAVHQGIFAFSDPDFAGLPIWEVFLWGFYVIHAVRALRLGVPGGSIIVPAILTALFAAVFGIGVSQLMLLAAWLIGPTSSSTCAFRSIVRSRCGRASQSSEAPSPPSSCSPSPRWSMRWSMVSAS